MRAGSFTVPPGTRLLHIGPHKTGTTALQGAFHRSRRKLTEHGVVYAGTGRQAKEPAVAINTAAPSPESRARWDAFCAEVAGAGDRRVAISSEFFAVATADTAHEVVKGLGGQDVHVVITLRPLRKILPSHWQQYVKHGLCHSYEDWLDGMLRRPPYDDPTPDFWHAQRHDALIRRWAEAAGPENLTVVVVDEAEPERQFRVFEELLDLPEGILESDGELPNSSLTYSQAELLLQVNRRLRDRKWTNWQQARVVREGVVPQQHAYRPSPEEPRIATPAWAEAAVADVAEEVVAGIVALGVRVVGDLSALTRRPSRVSEPVSTTEIPIAAAAEAVLGGIVAGVALGRQDRRAKAVAVDDPPVSKVPARDLLRVVGRRAVRRMRRRRMRRH